MDNFGLSMFGIFGKPTPVLWAVLPSLTAYIMYVVFKRSEKPEKRSLAYIPLAIGLILGILAELQARDTLYMRVAGFGPTTRLIFHATVVFPIVTAALIFFMDKRGFRGVDQNL